MRERYKCEKCGDVLHSREPRNAYLLKALRANGVIACKCAIPKTYAITWKIVLATSVTSFLIGWLIC